MAETECVHDIPLMSGSEVDPRVPTGSEEERNVAKLVCFARMSSQHASAEHGRRSSVCDTRELLEVARCRLVDLTSRYVARDDSERHRIRVEARFGFRARRAASVFVIAVRSVLVDGGVLS